MRGWASVLKILDLPYWDAQFGRSLGDVERALTSGVLQRPLYLRGLLLAPLNGLGPLLFSGVVLALSASSVRLALACFAIVCFFAGYPAIQFQQRHVFHLELIPLWLLALMVAGIFSWVGSVRTSGIDLSRATMTRLAARVVGVALMLSLIVVAPLYALRARQDVTVTALLDQYTAADRESLPLTPDSTDKGVVRIGADGLLEHATVARSTVSEMLVTRISTDTCDFDAVPLTFRYIATAPDSDFTRTITVQLPSDAGRHVDAYMPMYFTGMNNPQPHLLRFGGLEVPETRQACVSRFDRLRRPEAFPLLFDVQLTDRWRELPKYQRREPLEPAEAVMSYAFPTEMAVPRSLVRGLRDTVLEGNKVDYLDPTASIQGGLRVDGRSLAGIYIASWTEVSLAAGEFLFAEGSIRVGAISFGLADETGWVAMTRIVTPGRFRVYLQPPRLGRFTAAVINGGLIGQSQVELSLDKMMVVKGR